MAQQRELFQSDRGEFRRDPNCAEAVFKRIFPNPEVRQDCMRAIADSVETAHRCNPQAWEITLFPNKVHLNVGPIAVVYYSVGCEVYCTVDQHSIPNALRRRGDVRLEIRPGGVLPSVPGSAECVFSIESAGEVFPLIRAAHNRLIQAAAARCGSSTCFKSYSPGVIEYLSSKVGRQLPHPAYYAGGTGGTRHLSGLAVYARLHSDRLGEALSKGGEGGAVARKEWANALDLFERAEREGKELPIIFSAADP